MDTSSSSSWDRFMQSPAISYLAPTTFTADKSCSDYYWHRELLQKWHNIYTHSSSNSSDNESFDDGEERISFINYGSYILLSTLLAEKLRSQISLVIRSDGKEHEQFNNSNDSSSNKSLRIGIAIPEGPFLPLYILAVHSLNVGIGESWLTNNTLNKCNGVVLVPLEADEAPDRLQHMLVDSSPNLILVAAGKDMQNMKKVTSNISKSIQLVDYAQLLEEVFAEMQNTDIFSILEQLWPLEIRNDTIDSIRYPHAIPGECYDVARLVAIGVVRLKSSSFSTHSALLSTTQSQQSARRTVSHSVYTSGTTGKPKGCVSSLASLQHYIRAKNSAHGIDGASKILLASAITFDPCFSDILATCVANATLCIVPRDQLYSRNGGYGTVGSDDQNENYVLTTLLRVLQVTHVLCTPTLWSTVEGSPPWNVPSLKVVALGGEPIPKAMIGTWARSKTKTHDDQGEKWNRQYPRLCSTYGVTEACVYQTFGEVVLDCSKDDDCNSVTIDGMDSGISNKPGQSVGLPLLGTTIHICHPNPEDGDNAHQNNYILKRVQQDDSLEPAIGEVVLSGAQLDAMSSYLNLPELTSRVFVQSCQNDNDDDDGTEITSKDSYFYRTGDLGYVDSNTGHLHILGRIKGDGMVKINGVRIELAEIENSVIDDAFTNDDEGRLVVDCMAATSCTNSEDTEYQQRKQLIAYCILSPAANLQLDLSSEDLERGAIVPPGPLLDVLRARCDRRVRRGCTPSFFVLLDRFPLSPTGKRDRSALPPLHECCIMATLQDKGSSLWDTRVGVIVANKICDCLNLQQCQRQLVTTDANFFTLGGDSLAATRVVRGLYAHHEGILDSRSLGGSTGTLEGMFAAKYLLAADTLGDYVKFLDSKSAFQISTNINMNETNVLDNHGHRGDIPAKEESTDSLYESLIEAITLGYTSVASSLLDFTNPNARPNQGRLGKVTDRNQQRALFKSNPLHLACLRGNPYLVKRLLSHGCKTCCPDATGSFPIHLSCTRLEDKEVDEDLEDLNRLECVKLLLESGKTPISIKDGNKQTILHSAARGGHPKLLKYIMTQWKIAAETTGLQFKSQNNIPFRVRVYDWYDRWFRTPVHWAVLNQRVPALQILLEGGCSAFPPKPKSGVSKRSTNVIIESPLEMCIRLYGDDSGIGKEISSLLKNAEF